MTRLWWVAGTPAHLEQNMIDGGFVGVGPDLDARSSAQGLLAGAEPYSADVLDSLPNLRHLARIGIGFDAVDLEAATERGILVTNTPTGPTTSTAEHTMALILAISHEVKSSAKRLQEATGNYAAHQTSMELDGRTLGLVGGHGRIGTAVARMARAVGMRVVITDPASDESIPLAELLAASDVVSLHAPATSSTNGLFDTAAFAAMKPGSVFVNCARGALVVTDDLVEALNSGHLLGAGLDVTDPEPLDPSHPLLHMDNVIVTPHIASSTVVGLQRMQSMAFEQVSMGLRGERPTELLNDEVWKG